MSWNKLNNHELQAVRKLLMLDVAEAAKYIGKVSARTWQYWEAGRYAIPDDIDMEMYALVQLRNNFMDDLFLSLSDGDKIKYYHSFEEWVSDGKDDNKISWKIHQSAVSSLFCTGLDIELI